MERRTKSGFSLSEILVVLGLSGVIGAGVIGFFIQSIRSANAGEQNIELSARMRNFTHELVFNGSRSHEMILYHSAAPTDRTTANRKAVVNAETESFADDICPTGDFVVFVSYELPKPAGQSRYRIAKLVGYYLDKLDSGPPALVRITINLQAAPSTKTVEEILTENWSSGSRKVIAPRVLPLALSDNYNANTAPQLFYKRANENIAVCGQLLQSNARINTKDTRTYTRTFYFNVTVRS